MSRALVFVFGIMLVFAAMTWAQKPRKTAVPQPERDLPVKSYAKPSTDVLKKTLTAEQFKVACESGTEPPFRNAYWDNHEAGLYVDITTGEPLFSSTDKFDSGTGWPSFTRPVQKQMVVEKTDTLYGMSRTEVRSKSGDAHLGHVFDDGPASQGGLRYCINSASLRFVPVSKLAAEGYPEYVKLFEPAAQKK